MQFKYWLISEIGAIHDMSTAGMDDFVKEGVSYIYRFEIDGRPYEVWFTHDEARINDEDGNPFVIAHNVYGIDLQGPSGVLLTGLRVPHQVYTKLLLIVKKFVEEFDPDGLMAIASRPGMQPVYVRFFQRFGKDFIRVGEYTYLSKKYVDHLPPHYKALVARAAQEAANLGDVATAKATVNAERKEFLRVKEAMGKVVMYHYMDKEMLGVLERRLHNNMLGVAFQSKLFTHPLRPDEIKPVPLPLTPDLQKQYNDLRAKFGNVQLWTG